MNEGPETFQKAIYNCKVDTFKWATGPISGTHICLSESLSVSHPKIWSESNPNETWTWHMKVELDSWN